MGRIWKGVPLGFENGKPLANPGPAPTCWLGPPGSGKTAEGTINLLLDEPGKQSFIVLDSKGTVYKVTHEYRRKVCGEKNVKLANPENVLGLGSDGFNPAKLDPAAPDFEDRAQHLATAAIPETNEHQKHFTNAARSAVTAGIVDDVKYEASREKREPSFPKVRALWTQEPKKLQASVKRMLASGDPAITTRVAKFLGDTDELDNIKSTIEAATSPWMTKQMIADMETADGVDFAACRDRPTTIYGTLSTESLVDKGTYFRVFLSSAIEQLYRTPGLKTTIIIEEGFVCGRLEILEMAYATGREMGIDIVIVFQSVAQIRQLYPAQWKTFLAGAVLAYRAGESDSADWMAERAGKELVPMPSVSEPSPHDLDPRRSYQLVWRERIPAGSMYAMPKGTALVWLPGDDAPRFVTTRGYFAIPKLAARAGRNPYQKDKGGRKMGRMLGRIAAAASLAVLVGVMTPRETALHNLQSWLPSVLRSYVTAEAPPSPAAVAARRVAR
jgi:type IV secretory pathway TraG/TraD family ATPase VirD4